MNDISPVALFCSDVREERGPTASIIGVLPDNMNVERLPGNIPMMAIYVRMHIRIDFDPGKIFTRILLPDGKEIMRSDVEDKLLADTIAKAKAKGAPIAGLISTFRMANFPIASAGRILAVVTAGGREYVAGSLNINLVSEST